MTIALRTEKKKRRPHEAGVGPEMLSPAGLVALLSGSSDPDVNKNLQLST